MFTHKLIPEDISTHRINKQDFLLEIELSKEDALLIFAEMLKMYIFENYALLNYDKMRGFLHLGIGQECLYAFFMYWFNKTNSFDSYLMIGSYRCHNMAYISGSTFLNIARELLGKKTSPQKGKGGSMHLYNDKCFGGHGIVGAQVSIGTGLAFGLKYFNEHRQAILDFQKSQENQNKEFPKGSNGNKERTVKEETKNSEKCSRGYDQNNSREMGLDSEPSRIPVSKYPLFLDNKKAVFVFLGDGATNQGQVYESFNIALVHKLPIIFIIENNDISMWTDTKTVSDTDNYFLRWNMMPGIRIHSNNAFVVCCIMEQALQKYKTPFVVQIDTKRVCRHSAKEQTSFDIKNMRQDSQETSMHELESILVNSGLNSEVDFLWKNIHEEMRNCWETALSEELPHESELMKDILK